MIPATPERPDYPRLRQAIYYFAFAATIALLTAIVYSLNP